MTSTALKIWQLPDEQSKRLTEIAVEHSRLAASFNSDGLSVEQKEIIWNRIEALRVERVAILGE